MTKIAITGAKGRVGSVLVSGLDKTKFEIVPVDLPEHDVTKIDDLRKVLKGCDAIVHCAWKELRWKEEVFAPEDSLMTFNIYKVAKEQGIKKVIMTSSNHANRYDNANKSGKLTVDIAPIPDSVYGATKIFMEALGRYYSKNGLQVVCARIGNLNDQDKPRPLSEENPQRWLSHHDWISLVETILEKTIPDSFVVLNAVSKNRKQIFDWSNPLGWEPQDRVEENL